MASAISTKVSESVGGLSQWEVTGVLENFQEWPRVVESLAAGLYDAVGSPSQMKSALSRVREALGASTFVLFSLPAPGSREPAHYLVDGVSQRAMVEYQTHFFRYDVWVKAAIDANVTTGRWCCGHELVPPVQLAATYFGREFLGPQGLHDVLSGFLEVVDEHHDSAMVLSFHRRRERGLFDAPAKSLIRLLVPHCRRAMRLHMRLAPQFALGNSLRELFQQADSPMFYVTAQGRLLEANAAGQAYLRADAGQAAIAASPGLESRPVTLSVHLADGWRDLSTALDPLFSQADPSLTVQLAGTDGSDQELAIRRVHVAQDDDAYTQPVFAICMVKRRPVHDAIAQIATRFGLTPCEVETVRLLGHGQSPLQIAQSRGVRISTVRSHISSSLAKTGTSRQMQLLSLIARLPAHRRPGSEGTSGS